MSGAYPLAVCGDTVTLMRLPHGTMHRVENAKLADAVRRRFAEQKAKAND